jgi:hypothetical protein
VYSLLFRLLGHEDMAISQATVVQTWDLHGSC